MRILPININTFKNINSSKKHNLFASKMDSFEKITFKGNIPKELAYKIPNNTNIYNLLNEAQTEENLRGIGANSKVYNIPYLDDFVLKVLNKNDPNGINFDEFPSDINLGQPIWQSDRNKRHLVLKKVEGKEHSIPAWSNTIWDNSIKKPLPVTKEQSNIYFNSVKKLASMPQAAFDEIALKTKILSDKNYKIDSINPNNLIVDDNEIHIIDYFKVKPREQSVYQNCSYDLIAIMLDFTLLPEYFEKMNSEQQKEFLQNAKTIFDKVQQGAENSNLSTDIEIYKTYIKETSKWFVTTSAIDESGKEHIRLYDYRANDFLNWLSKLK